jgi:hypothetical protein
MGGGCRTYREIRDVYKVLMEKTEKKRPLGSHRLEDNIKMEHQGVDVKAWNG